MAGWNKSRNAFPARLEVPITDELEDWLERQARASKRFPTKAAITRLALHRLQHTAERCSIDSLSEHLPKQPASRDGRKRPRPSVKLQFFVPKRKQGNGDDDVSR